MKIADPESNSTDDDRAKAQKKAFDAAQKARTCYNQASDLLGDKKDPDFSERLREIRALYSILNKMSRF